MVRRALLVPADVHRSAGLVAGDLLRDASVDRCVECCAAYRNLGDDVHVDLGDRGLVAAEVARELDAFRPDETELWYAVTHRRAAFVLRDALAERGLACVLRTVAAGAEAAPGVRVLPLVPEPQFRISAGAELLLPAVPPKRLEDALPSPFSPALHLGNRGWLDTLGRSVRPDRIGAWRVLVQAHDSLVQPLLQIYALHAWLLRQRDEQASQ